MNLNQRLVKFLSEGLTQKEIAIELKKLEIKPNSLSSVEKYLKSLREEFGAKTLFHLACILYHNNEYNIKEISIQ